MGDTNIKSVELLFTKPNGCVGLNKSIEFFVTFDVVLSYKHTHNWCLPKFTLNNNATRLRFAQIIRRGFNLTDLFNEMPMKLYISMLSSKHPDSLFSISLLLTHRSIPLLLLEPESVANLCSTEHNTRSAHSKCFFFLYEISTCSRWIQYTFTPNSVTSFYFLHWK